MRPSTNKVPVRKHSPTKSQAVIEPVKKVEEHKLVDKIETTEEQKLADKIETKEEQKPVDKIETKEELDANLNVTRQDLESCLNIRAFGGDLM